jgi:hypothetical protein
LIQGSVLRLGADGTDPASPDGHGKPLTDMQDLLVKVVAAGAAMGDRRTADEGGAAYAVVWRPAGKADHEWRVHRPKYDD